jgi:chemotaxis protein methyltransferase CheR
MTSISAEEFNSLSKYIYSICGVALDSTKTYLIETRLKSMLQRYACASYMDLHAKARADASGIMEKEIVNAITTNETLFFRDSSPFEVFKHKILPDLIDARSKSAPGRPVPIRIWSAACSTGQEVYSIAIALREALGNLNNFQISILGTDISDEAVTKASYGKYNKFEIERGLPPQTLNRYFTLMGDGWKIKDEIRAMAVFKKFNLMKPFAGLGRFDVVFCRNVAIYFTPADKKTVFEKIAGVLESDGSLIIGSTESLTGVTNVFEAKRYMRSIFYQISSGGGPSFASAPAAAAPLYRPAPPTAPAPAAPPRPTLPAPRPAAAPRPAPAQVQSPVQAPRPESPRPAPAAPIPVPMAPEPALAPEAAFEAREDAPARTAPAQRPPAPRTQPVQVYRAGDKSELKRLLMQKKQGKA